MPLYQHKSGERVRTVPGSAEDERLTAADDWSPVDESRPAEGKAPATAKEASK